MTDQLDIFDQDLEGLDDEEAPVWRIIREHRGRGSAIKVDQIAWQTGLKDQRVRETVAHLVIEHGKIIGSATSPPAGYYVIVDAEELRAHIKSLRHRGIMCLVRASKLSQQSIEDIFKQGRIEFNEAG
jgi:hypothetical protein